MKPTIYLSNWSSSRTPGHHGPGRKHTIMAKPRRWEHGCGTVSALVPSLDDLEDVHAGRIGVNEYRARYQRKLAAFGSASLLALFSQPTDGRGPRNVEDGDTLCCACSRADAAAGNCHRVWAAHMLAQSGWRVVLDGVELP